MAGNDLNVFPYAELPQKGVASSMDMALSVRRPVAVTRTYMFRHVYHVQPSICVEDLSLKEIMANGTKPLEPLYKMWNKENFVKEFEDIIYGILG